MTDKRYGVRLALPGASGPHDVPGLHMIVTDEPTGELDKEQVGRVRGLIREGAPIELVDLDKAKTRQAPPQPDEVAAQHSDIDAPDSGGRE